MTKRYVVVTLYDNDFYRVLIRSVPFVAYGGLEGEEFKNGLLEAMNLCYRFITIEDEYSESEKNFDHIAEYFKDNLRIEHTDVCPQQEWMNSEVVIYDQVTGKVWVQ